MVGIKNKSEKKIHSVFDGVHFDFGPGEIKVVDLHVAHHLMRATAFGATGVTPLVIIPEKDVPAELLKADPVASPELYILRNGGSAPQTAMHDGVAYTVPAKGKLPLPAHVAKSIYQRLVTANKPDIFLDVPKPKPAKAPEKPSEK